MSVVSYHATASLYQKYAIIRERYVASVPTQTYFGLTNGYGNSNYIYLSSSCIIDLEPDDTIYIAYAATLSSGGAGSGTIICKNATLTIVAIDG